MTQLFLQRGQIVPGLPFPFPDDFQDWEDVHLTCFAACQAPLPSAGHSKETQRCVPGPAISVTAGDEAVAQRIMLPGVKTTHLSLAV